MAAVGSQLVASSELGILAAGESAAGIQSVDIVVSLTVTVVTVAVVVAETASVEVEQERRCHLPVSGAVQQRFAVNKVKEIKKLILLPIFLALNAPTATKCLCFSRLMKCLRSLYGKQCGPRSDCSSVLGPHCLLLYLIRQ